ncbi:9249_t:CDS:2, partial [Acaulospora colombiana]
MRSCWWSGESRGVLSCATENPSRMSLLSISWETKAVRIKVTNHQITKPTKAILDALNSLEDSNDVISRDILYEVLSIRAPIRHFMPELSPKDADLFLQKMEHYGLLKELNLLIESPQRTVTTCNNEIDVLQPDSSRRMALMIPFTFLSLCHVSRELSRPWSTLFLYIIIDHAAYEIMATLGWKSLCFISGLTIGGILAPLLEILLPRWLFEQMLLWSRIAQLGAFLHIVCKPYTCPQMGYSRYSV